MINTLNTSNTPDESHLDTDTKVIKEGGTVESSVAYELDDEVTPVTLIATKGTD